MKFSVALDEQANCSLMNGQKIEPDIMMVAKGMGGGFPLGAVLAKENAASGMTTGTMDQLMGVIPWVVR